MKYYLDTNIIIYAAKGTYPHLIDHFMNKDPGDIVIPAIVLSEIEYGAHKSVNYDKTMAVYGRFFRVFRVIPFSSRAAFYAGKIRSDLEKKGTPIGMYDTLIAGTVLADAGVLVTHNVSEFGRVEELKLEDWTA